MTEQILFDQLKLTIPGNWEVSSENTTMLGAKMEGKDESDISSILRLANEAPLEIDTQAFDLVGGISMQPKGGEELGAKPDGDKDTQGSIEVEVGPNEEALLLIEQGGIFHWEIPETRTGDDTKTETFKLSLDEEVVLADDEDGMSNFFGESWVRKQVKIYFYRRVAKKAVPTIRDLIERNVVEGGRVIEPDIDGYFRWRYVSDLSGESIPADQPVLLMVHGTASSSFGSFGALRTIEEGREFLKKASEKYGLIVGYDHKTISVDPEKNARELLAFLKTANWGNETPRIDCVAFSRGGLVLRTLTQRLLPKDDWNPKIGKSVFVGCTNAGTMLGRPENLKDALNLYTNLVLGGAKVLKMLGLTGVGTIAAESMRILQGLAEAIVEEGVTHNGTPGLAAMNPDGNFVDELNGLDTDTSAYHAITANFEPLEAPESMKAWAKELKVRVLDNLADNVFQEDNDLVVHQRSMTQVDDTGTLKFNDVFDFPSNGGVFHTIYFAQPETAQKLGEWLQA